MYSSCSNPTNKTETGIANRWRTINSKPHGPMIMMGQSETLSSSYIIFITLISAGAQQQRCWVFYQRCQPAQLCWAKTIFLSQTGIWWIFFIHLYCAGSHTEHLWRCSKFYLMSRSEDFTSWQGRIFLLYSLIVQIFSLSAHLPTPNMWASSNVFHMHCVCVCLYKWLLHPNVIKSLNFIIQITIYKSVHCCWWTWSYICLLEQLHSYALFGWASGN